MYCGNCGVKLFEEDNYCRSCGSKIAKTMEPTSTSRAIRDTDSAADRTGNTISASQAPNNDDAFSTPDSFAFAGATVPATYLEAEREFKEEQKGFEKTIGSLKLKYDADGKVKFGGWLYLFSPGIFLAPLFAFIGLRMTQTNAWLFPIIGIPKWLTLMLHASPYITILTSTYMFFLYYKKDKFFPSFYVAIWTISQVIDLCLIIILINYLSPEWFIKECLKQWLIRLFAGGLWCTYILCSKRVKHTFVN